MRVLLMGGAGRVGRWIVPHLRKWHEVVTFDRTGDADVLADALDPDAVRQAAQGMDAIVHLCAVVPRGERTRDPETLAAAWATNVGSWWVALEEGRQAGVQTFAYGSSLSVHSRFAQELFPPDDPPDSTAPYGFSKRVAESAGELYASQFGLHVSSLRLCLPTDDEVAPRWVRPATGEVVEVRLPDGTFIPSTPASRVAEFVDASLRFKGTFQALDVVGEGMPWAS